MGLTTTPERQSLVEVSNKSKVEGNEGLDEKYDSGGMVGLFCDQVIDEDDTPMDAEEPASPEAPTQEENKTTTPIFYTFTDDEINAMEVPDLWMYLKDHYGTKLSGLKKAELREKMNELIWTHLPFVSALDPTVATI